MVTLEGRGRGRGISHLVKQGGHFIWFMTIFAARHEGTKHGVNGVSMGPPKHAEHASEGVESTEPALPFRPIKTPLPHVCR